MKALPKMVKKTMRKTGVPGIAVAVVHKDKVIYKRGFGVRSTKTGKKVKPSTIFQVASVSKSIGASVVAAAVTKKLTKWTTPISQLTPGFALADPWVTDHVTVGDLYSHRSGLPGMSGNDLEAFGFDRKTIIDRLRYEPLSPFRTTYSYSNFGMTTAGDAVAQAAGTSWEALAKRLVFKPVGMKRSTYSHAEFVKQKNRAALHQIVKGKWLPYSKRNADAQAPAGGLSSSALDMARWLRMELDNGKFSGERIVGKGRSTRLARCRSVPPRSPPPPSQPRATASASMFPWTPPAACAGRTRCLHLGCGHPDHDDSRSRSRTGRADQWLAGWGA